MLVDHGFIYWLLWFRAWLSLRCDFDSKTSKLLLEILMVSVAVGVANKLLKSYYQKLESSKELVP